jgi:GNAT superfamily N-acetyltransferase
MSAGLALLRDLLGLGRAVQPELWGRLHARPVHAADEPFLRCLYASSHADQLRDTGWAPARCRTFLDEQFDFQQRHFLERHPEALFLMLVLDGQPIGRLSWHGTAERITLIDLCLAPAWRRRGVGGRVLGWLAETADRRGVPIGLHLARDSAAFRLARRFGFNDDPSDGGSLCVAMTRAPRQSAAVADARRAGIAATGDADIASALQTSEPASHQAAH